MVPSSSGTPVSIEGSEGAVGTLAGAAIGGIAGSTLGGDKGSEIAAILGGVTGGMLGNMTEKDVTQQHGVELTIQLDNGNYISVVQEVDQSQIFENGDKVKILTHGKTTRVVRAR